jgi:NAD(P)-dependent dehydrogenase (short-subunit alcohol dehydrogenase family)
MSKLDGKIALITGGTSGIGLAVAQEFVKEGAYVFVTGRRQPALNQAIQTIGRSVAGVQADASSLDDLDTLYVAIKKDKGRLDILVANAGGGAMAPLGSITEEHYDATFDTNVKGTLFTVQKALPLMSRGASIILTASTTSITGTPAFSVYSASKAAVRSFARSWTLDLKELGIRVNAVSPGPTNTPGLAASAGQTLNSGKVCSAILRLKFPWVGWARRKKSPRRWYSWPQATAPSSPASNCSSTAESPRCRNRNWKL